ncbi:MAG: hypothetical protein H5U40_07975, partial [Polyangiaceae bacterium]|nr:hypothetical protein [Polyangiaceae bacterium]
PELVEGAHRAALDEVRHARLCYGIATALDGVSVGPELVEALHAALDRAVARPILVGVGDGLERYGLAGPALHRECVDHAAREVRELLDALVSGVCVFGEGDMVWPRYPGGEHVR